ncbi:MAG: multifunctional oxoglutarate decarboxylase/oxoglutarate dehydrogenase thiamine pyrophosphate-binding subunit/dihydrolipoyllysine-residue succinyltransferase subunit, partial [Actinobacteria bacterium]|nr:multifunctional oxoglutarate decarboxylase/oxoglutarate dehydrogenase thiamine pyrophosphate-binding subunit/dihydrolipoyllysine-residue succinyltransferase subunit [Actinomycetota bacterium]
MDPFGANEWLVEELYDLYQQDKNNVDPHWWDFFADYTPASAAGARPIAAAVAAPVAPVAAPKAAPLPPTAPAVAAPAVTPPAPAGASKAADAGAVVLKGPAARVVTNMEASLTVPTATSVRAVPARLLEDNRVVINNHLARTRGGKVSFTHLIGFAIVKAASEIPEMNGRYTEVDGKPALVSTDQVNLGLAIDLTKPDGTRQLLVPSIKGAQGMDFAQFHGAYEDMVRKARNNKLTVDDFAGTTMSLTNPGGLGTNLSVPRLMTGQGCIIGVGSLDYPAEWEGASAESIARNAVSRILTLTSTY